MSCRDHRLKTGQLELEFAIPGTDITTLDIAGSWNLLDVSTGKVSAAVSHALYSFLEDEQIYIAL